MRRIFTFLALFVIFFLVKTKSFGQNCATSQPNPNVCSPVAENFNSSDEGFVAGTDRDNNLTYSAAGGFFDRNVAGNAPQTATSTITSHSYTKRAAQPGVIQTGFKVTGGKISITSIKVDILNASTNALVASCTQTPTIVASNTPQTVCIGLFSNAIVEGLAVKIRFTIGTTNTGSGNGGHTFTFDDFSVGETGDNAALPVTFTSFNAKKLAIGTQLTWNVGTEENVSRYEIERSNGAAYVSVGSVSATGLSSYTFTDPQSAQGTVLYRIRSVDNDGKYKYSTIISLKNGVASILLKAFPIPARNTVTVQHPVIDGNGQITLAAGDGRTVKSVLPAKGSMQTEIKLDGLKAGIYLLRFNDGNGQLQTMKIIKQ